MNPLYNHANMAEALRAARDEAVAPGAAADVSIEVDCRTGSVRTRITEKDAFRRRPRSEWSRPVVVDESPTIAKLDMPSLDKKFERISFPKSLDVDELMCAFRGDLDIQESVQPTKNHGGFEMLCTMVVGVTEAGSKFAVSTNHSLQGPGDFGQRALSVSPLDGGDLCSTAGLSHKEKDHLFNRLLHHAMARDTIVSSREAIYFHLRRVYLRGKQWKNLVHLSLTCCRRETTGTPPWCVCASQLGEALESAGRFSDAGPIYEAVAPARLALDDPYECAIAFQNAAVAWRRAGDFERGEVCYVSTLRHGGEEMLAHLECFYDRWRHSDTSFNDLSAVLSSLLDAVNYKSKWRLPPVDYGGMKPLSHRGRKHARRILDSLSRAKDPQALRAAILEAKNPKFACHWADHDPTSNSDGQAVAQHYFNKDGPISAPTRNVKCSACGTWEPEPKTFKACSRCKLVYYCGPACQKDAWPGHKGQCKKR